VNCCWLGQLCRRLLTVGAGDPRQNHNGLHRGQI
jgi:hypothetical protein